MEKECLSPHSDGMARSAALAKGGGVRSYWCSRSEQGRPGLITPEGSDPCGRLGIHLDNLDNLDNLDKSYRPVGVAPNTGSKRWHNTALYKVAGRSGESMSLVEAVVIT